MTSVTPDTNIIVDDIGIFRCGMRTFVSLNFKFNKKAVQ